MGTSPSRAGSGAEFYQRQTSSTSVALPECAPPPTTGVDVEGQGASSGSTNTGKASAPVRGEEGSGRGAHIPLTRKHGHLHYIRILMRYVWPRGMWCIRFRVIVALFCLVASKVVTVVTPFGVKNIIDDLSVGEFPLQWILWMSFGKCISLGLTNLRDSVFVHVTVHAVREVGSETFSHLHTLSMLFHTKRKTGALLRAMDRGASGINFIFSFLLFDIFPTFLELVFAVGILMYLFDPWISVVILGTVSVYATTTIVFTDWRTKIRRRMNELNNEANNIATDSLINAETVKYFANEDYETSAYRNTLREHGVQTVRAQNSVNLVSVILALTIGMGSFGVLFLTCQMVLDGRMSVGSVVMVNSYLMQLYLPLNSLGRAYRMIKNAMVDMENMFDLLEEHQDVKDAPGAPPLQVRAGEIRFEDVCFAYGDKRQVLHNINFSCEGGHMVALVGESGAGKSTISKLLFRMYDPTAGRIIIDGQDISQCTQRSVRKEISIVPQDTVLFNKSIAYNIQYGRVDASQQEIEEVARMAQIHDFVMSLPSQYETVTGERGLRLSGGEKQRVAIARCFLKNSPIMVFDEATSSLDSRTEADIQDALKALAAGRTTLVVAHRLSTVVSANLILVLRGGRIVERGTHEELLQQEGFYHQMWMRQIAGEDLQDEAVLPSEGEEESPPPLRSILSEDVFSEN